MGLGNGPTVFGGELNGDGGGGVKTSVVIDNQAVEKTAAYSVVNGDVGKTFYIKDGNAVTFTLPAISDGRIFKFVNLNDDGRAALTISPNAADGIMWTASSTDDKDLINTAATANKGDYVVLAAFGSTVFWQVLDIRGTWAKEA